MRLHTQGLSAADHGAKGERFGRLPGDVRQQAIELGLDHLVALAVPRLQTWAIEHGDPASLVMNQPSVTQICADGGMQPLAPVLQTRAMLIDRQLPYVAR
jgi:hypothetical protein